jgi:hypothetical protein
VGETVTIAVTLPQEVLDAAESERKVRGETRDELFRRAIEALLRRDGQDAIERYAQGYREQPETDEEIAAFHNASAAILARDPWD